MRHLLYHPAFDAYHAALRALQIIHFNPLQAFERERLRIIDFYLIFPERIKDIRVPRQHSREQKAAAEKSNHYHFSGTPVIVFNNMAVWHNAAMSLLLSKSMINRASFLERNWVVVANELPPVMKELISARIAPVATRLSFLVNVLSQFPVYGKDGLKDRTGLLGFKYDSA